MFDYLSTVKLYAEAEETFPHKFAKEIAYNDTLNQTRDGHPEYFPYDKKLSWKYYYG